MKLALFALLATGCLIAVARSEEEYDYEEEEVAAAPAPVTPSAPAKTTSGRLGGLLSSRGRVNVGRKGPATTQGTTAKPVEQPAEAEEEVELEENQDQQEEVATTTTESSKIVRGGVRPFRSGSNQDLLAALKRRRAQVPSHRETSASQSTGESTTPKSKASTSNRAKSTAAIDSKSSGRGRFGGTRGKPVQEEVEETQREEVQVKPKPYRRG